MHKKRLSDPEKLWNTIKKLEWEVFWGNDQHNETDLSAVQLLELISYGEVKFEKE